jgi:hypothetical protein
MGTDRRFHARQDVVSAIGALRPLNVEASNLHDAMVPVADTGCNSPMTERVVMPNSAATGLT